MSEKRFFLIVYNVTILLIIDLSFMTHISAKSSWDSSVGVQIPIMAHVKGKIYMQDGTNHPFEHYYNFFHFRPYHDEVQSQSYEVSLSVRDYIVGRQLKSWPFSVTFLLILDYDVSLPFL